MKNVFSTNLTKHNIDLTENISNKFKTEIGFFTQENHINNLINYILILMKSGNKNRCENLTIL